MRNQVSGYRRSGVIMVRGLMKVKRAVNGSP